MTVEHSGSGRVERHYAFVTRTVDIVLGTQMRGNVYFTSPTLTGIYEYPDPAEPSFPLAGGNGEGFFWVPQPGDLIEIEINMAEDFPTPRILRGVYNDDDDIAGEFKTNYPFRMGFRSRQGHILLFDTTPGILTMILKHPTGSGFEWDLLGNETHQATDLKDTILGETDRTYVRGVVEKYLAETERTFVKKLRELYSDDIERRVLGQIKETVAKDIIREAVGEIVNKATTIKNTAVSIELNKILGGSVLTTITDPVVDDIVGRPHIGVPTVLAG